MQQLLAIRRFRLKIAEDVFDEDHGRIDDDAEIDRADREQVCVFAAQHQKDRRKRQGKRDIGRDDDRAAQIPEEDPLDQEYQEAAEQEVVQHRVRRQRNQRAAVVIGHQLDPGRQRAVLVHLGDLGLDRRQHIVGVVGPVHHDDRRGDVVIVVAPGDAEPRHVTDVDFGDVPDLDRDAVHLAEDDIVDVVDLVALGQIVGAAVVDQPDAADVDRLLADRNLAAADVDIGVAQRGDHLRDGEAVAFELVQVDIDIELLGRAAPAVDLDDPGHGEQAAQRDPILHRAQIGQSEMRRPDDLVAIDFTDEARLLNARHLVPRQRHILLQAEGRLRIREVIIEAIFESDAYERQPVEGCRTNIIDPWRRIKPDLHRYRVVALHFLGREAGGLGGDFEDHRSGIGIGLDIQLGVGDHAAAGDDQQAEEDNRA